MKGNWPQLAQSRFWLHCFQILIRNKRKLASAGPKLSPQSPQPPQPSKPERLHHREQLKPPIRPTLWPEESFLPKTKTNKNKRHVSRNHGVAKGIP